MRTVLGVLAILAVTLAISFALSGCPAKPPPPDSGGAVKVEPVVAPEGDIDTDEATDDGEEITDEDDGEEATDEDDGEEATDEDDGEDATDDDDGDDAADDADEDATEDDEADDEATGGDEDVDPHAGHDH